MKPTKLLLMVLLLALAGVGLGRADQATKSPPGPVVGKGAKPGTLRFGPFKGWGVTDELAQQQAVERALRFLEGYAEELNPPRSWNLTPAGVRQQFVKSLEALPNQDVEGEGVKCWRLWVEITPQQGEALDREARSRERMSLLAKVMLLVVLAAGALGGYLRIEEWAHWRSTCVPRLAGAGLLAAVGAGAWLLW